MSDELQQRLDHGMYGSPKINPEEQNRYLGTFRERCYLQMTLEQMKEPQLQEQFQTHLSEYQEASCLINGRVNEHIQAIYIGILTKSNINFTIVSSANQTTSIGLLLISKEAVHEEIIDIEKKYHQKSLDKIEKKESSSFFKKFFG